MFQNGVVIFLLFNEKQCMTINTHCRTMKRKHQSSWIRRERRKRVRLGSILLLLCIVIIVEGGNAFSLIKLYQHHPTTVVVTKGCINPALVAQVTMFNQIKMDDGTLPLYDDQIDIVDVVATATDKKSESSIIIASDDERRRINNNIITSFESTIKDNNNEVISFPTNEKNMMLALLWIIACLSSLDRVAMSIALVPMSDEFLFTDTVKGSISSLFSLGYGIGIIPAGLWVATASPTIVLACGIVLWSLATLVTPATAQLLVVSVGATMAPLLFARAIVGAGESLVLPTAQRLLTIWTTADQKGFGMAFLYLNINFPQHCSSSMGYCTHIIFAFFFRVNSHCLGFQWL
jgi:Major Facilitator Superfamily